MSSLTREEAVAQIADIQRRLAAMTQEPPFGHGGNDTREEAARDDQIRRALRNAAMWLGDVTNPLTPQEREVWDDVAHDYCTDMARDMGASLYDFMITDAERRPIIESEDEGDL